MSVVSGESGFTELDKLNLREKLLIKGVPIVTPVQANNIIIINQESDFPTQDATTITLEANKVHQIGASFTTVKNFIVSDNSSITTSTQAGTVLTYTGTAPMFTLLDVDFRVVDFTFNCPNATIFEATNTTPANLIFVFNWTCFSCTNIANINNYLVFQSINAVVINFTGTGLVFSGANVTLIDISRMNIFQDAANTNPLIDFGTAVVSQLSIDRFILVTGTPAAVGITGAANSANIVPTAIGTISNGSFFGPGSPVSGISPSDIRWDMEDNGSSLIDSHTDGDSFLSAPQTVPNPGIGVFVDVGGTNWISSDLERFTSSTAGVLTYIGEIAIHVLFSGTGSIHKEGFFFTDVLAVRIRKNATSLARSQSVTENQFTTSVTSQASETVSQNDTVAMQVANLDNGTNNIVVTAANLIVRS